VVHHLEMPDPFAGLRVEAQQAVGEQVVAGAFAAVPVVGGAARRHVDVAELLVDAHRRPRLAAAGVFPGVLVPRLDTILAGARHDVELPAQRAGLDVVAADITRWDVGFSRRRRAALAADDHDAAHDDR